MNGGRNTQLSNKPLQPITTKKKTNITGNKMKSKTIQPPISIQSFRHTPTALFINTLNRILTGKSLCRNRVESKKANTRLLLP